ncbi:class A beta-lactamase [Streptomyces sp. HNM0574]|uniref:class A beta-lactamase n=1 Tax=Streptomyces sp. HNM0574 TaxID=2714954 RepID=UPI00146DE8E5|nr:class A beta-lactamase [Streptomyces sp. HNM0574]NLU69416.1 class A beta-lactamase [Streptomyces sp. HNM0574]
MQHTRTRRGVLAALTTLALVAPLTACAQEDSRSSAHASDASAASAAKGEDKQPADAAREFRKLERKFDAKLGVYAVDTGSGREISHHGDDRFPYNSTFKALAAGAVLKKHSPEEMERVVRYAEKDLVPNSPVTEKHVEDGMTVRALCDAAVRYSDNTAANLLFDELGGPEGLDAELEGLGDDVTRMVNREPDLSDWAPGSTDDTSTPRAMAKNLRAYVLGDVLGKKDRAQLTKWLRTNTTGAELIQAGVPEEWTVGDKSGAGSGYGTRNDLAVVWRPDAAPLVVSVMSHRDGKTDEYDNALIAEAASVVADSLG